MIAVSADARMGVIGVGGGVPSATCGSIQISDTTSSSAITGNDASNEYLMGTFTAASTSTIKTLYLYLNDVGMPIGYSVDVAICTTSSGLPTETCTNFDSGISGALTGTYARYKFNISAGYAISSGTVYAIRLHANQTDVANYYNWAYNASGSMFLKKSDSSFTWVNGDATADVAFEITSCFE